MRKGNTNAWGLVEIGGTRVQGEINVGELMRQVGRDRVRLQRWRERHRRAEERMEETAVLNLWWRTDEQDRAGVADKHREVFARIRSNRARAHDIEREERRIIDQAMATAGYQIRPGRVWPRYVPGKNRLRRNDREITAHNGGTQS